MTHRPILLLLSAMTTAAVALPLSMRHLAAPHAFARHKRVIESWRAVPDVASSDPTIRPSDYGADPTGNTDSTAAFNATVTALLQSNKNGQGLANGIIDLGGACIDLSGGTYLISGPIVLPSNYGNFRVVNGAIRASNSFPRNRYVIEVGTDQSCTNSQHSCNEDIGFQGIFLDANQVAAGCLHIVATMGATVGPQMFLFNFTSAGLLIDGGHEVMVDSSWFGEFIYSDPRKENGTASVAVGIQINGNDHYVTNTIVFSSHIGVVINGAADILNGVHTWNLATANGGTGILVLGGQNRLEGCYLDYNELVIENPQLITVLNGFYLEGGRIQLVPTTPTSTINGLYIAGNEFQYYGGSGSNVLDTVYVNASGSNAFVSVNDCTIEGSLLSSPYLNFRGPAVTKTWARSQPTSNWTVDFTDNLLFDTTSVPITSIQYSLTLDGASPLVTHAARSPSGNFVTVVTDQPVAGSLTISVDQSARSS